MRITKTALLFITTLAFCAMLSGCSITGGETAGSSCTHTNGSWWGFIYATCEADGEKTFSCDDCSHSYTEAIPATGHNYGEWYTIEGKEPTCTEVGEEYRHCQNLGCDKHEYREAAALGHTAETQNYIAPTCINRGSTGYERCSVCLDGLSSSEFFDALGHDFVDGYCSRCFIEEGSSPLLAFELNEEGKYSVSGLKYKSYLLDPTIDTVNIVIPTKYNGIEVTEIADKAFYQKDIESIHISSSIKIIGDEAFYECESLKSVTMDNGVVTIDDFAFSRCINLSSIHIPASVKTINRWAFCDCALTGATIAENSVLEKIGYCAFSSLSEYQNNLSGFRLPNTITDIGDSAFQGCSGLENVSIPDSVKNIGERAFANTDIGGKVFSENSKLEYVEEKAFYGCTNITGVVITEGAKFSNYAFEGCSGIKSVEILGTHAENDSYIFYDCTGIKSVTIAQDVTSISSCIFDAITLDSLTIPSSLTTFKNPFGDFVIGTLHYYSDASVSTLVGSANKIILYGTSIPEGIASINVKEVVIGENITEIGESAFSGCKTLEKINIPSTITAIGASAFSGCVSLANVYASDLESWCGYEFANMYSNPLGNGANLYFDGELVKGIDFEDTEAVCGKYTFAGCTSLEEVTTNFDIPYGAFQNCTSLTMLNFNDATSIGDYAFSGCIQLRHMWCDRTDFNHIGAYAFQNAGFIAFSIPEAATTISEGAFKGCNTLTKVWIPSGIESIGKDAFSSCINLVEVVNESNLELTVGKSDNGYVAYYAKQILTDDAESKITITDDEFVYYNNYYLVGAPNFKELVLPETFNGERYEIYKNFFNNRRNLEKVTYPDSGVILDYHYNGYYENVFGGSSSLTEIDIGDGISSIPDWYFGSCENLTTLIIGKGLRTLSYSNFVEWDSNGNHCEKLIDIQISEENEYLRAEDGIVYSKSDDSVIFTAFGKEE